MYFQTLFGPLVFDATKNVDYITKMMTNVVEKCFQLFFDTGSGMSL